jgi:hypothetical protein
MRLRVVKRREVHDHDRAVDEALLHALDAHANVAVDIGVVRRACARAVVGLDDARRIDRTRRRAVALIHRWLTARNALGLVDDLERADRMLRRILEPGSAARARRVERALTWRGALDTRIERLEHALRADPAIGEATKHSLNDETRVIAALHLIGSAAAGRVLTGSSS